MKSGPLSVEGPLRDKKILNEVDTVVAVSVRDNGNMLELGLKAIADKKEVFVIPPPDNSKYFEGNRKLLRAGIKTLNIEIQLPEPKKSKPIFAENSPSSDYIWHFTKRSTCPWPGQSLDEYFESLIDNEPGSSHSALDALNRILQEKCIRASEKLIKGKYPVVCFTACSPKKLMGMKQYRAALLRWNYEPFGIGIPIEIAKSVGIKPVKYLSPEQYSGIKPEERFLYQKHLPPEIDYSAEQEWRHLGDLNLSNISNKDIFTYCENF